MSELKYEWIAWLRMLIHPFAVTMIIIVAGFIYAMSSLETPSLRDYSPERHQQLFAECMTLAASTVKAGHYNDSNEVLTNCSRIARHMAQDEMEAGDAPKL